MEGSAGRNKPLKKGFTTGSCAAAASRAAAAMVFGGKVLSEISIWTPAGTVFSTKMNYVNLRKGRSASCAVLKDGGDDPDVTTGLYIYSRVEIEEEEKEKENDIMSTIPQGKIHSDFMSTKNEGVARDENAGFMSTKSSQPLENAGKTHEKIMSTNLRSASACSGIVINIDGGEGIGRVTKPGLDQGVGEAAINSVPRKMIEEAVRSEALRAHFQGRIRVTISAPGGEVLAKKTFNPRLGIEGGISILGTSGVEEPMSTQAIIDTIKAEMKLHRAAGEKCIAMTPGNYGRDYLLKAYGYDIERSVQCSNYIGAAIELAGELGFEAMLLTGHIGKLIKLAGGMTNTHSSNGDCRMELLCAAVIRAGGGAGLGREVLECISTEEALRHIRAAGLMEETMAVVLSRVMQTLTLKAGEGMRMECMIYSNDFGCLAQSDGAGELIKTIKEGV